MTLKIILNIKAMKKIIYGNTFLVVFAALSGCSSPQDKKVGFNGAPVTVTLAKTGTENGGSFSNASGKLVSKNTVNLSTRMMGYITSISVEVGQQVNAGQQLVTINNTDIQAKGGQADAQIIQAQAAHDAAKKDYERFRNLFNTQSASQKELDDMKVRFDMANASLKAAKLMKSEVNAQYRYSNITAPISGTITEKFAEQGDLASPGMPLLTIESPGILQAQVMVSENNIVRVKNGMEAQVLIKSSGKEISGKVAEISRSSANTGGQYLVNINLPVSKELLPGMFVNVRFPFDNAEEVSNKAMNIHIPKSSLVQKGQLTGVYTISAENTSVLRWLRLGKETGDEVEVLSGLKAGESYVLHADGKLFNGAKVKLK